MDYDALLKSILQLLANRLIPLLTGASVVDQLSVEFPSVESRLPDLVALLDDDRILHLEVQTANDARMPWRMLRYWLLLSERYPEADIVQIVLYLGNPRPTMADGFDLPFLHYRYEVRDIREFDADILLSAPSATERILAVLGRSVNPRAVIRRLLESWTAENPKEWASLVKRLMMISALRKLANVAKQEVLAMPLIIDLENDEVFGPYIQRGVQQGMTAGHQQGLLEGRRKGLQEGRQAGEAAILRAQLQRKFAALPAWVHERLTAASTDELERWSLRILEASELTQVFD